MSKGIPSSRSVSWDRSRPPKDSGGEITSFQAWIRERGRPIFKRVPSRTFLNSLLSAGRARIPSLTTIIMLPASLLPSYWYQPSSAVPSLAPAGEKRRGGPTRYSSLLTCMHECIEQRACSAHSLLSSHIAAAAFDSQPLVSFKISKFYKISYHIESLNACIKY